MTAADRATNEPKEGRVQFSGEESGLVRHYAEALVAAAVAEDQAEAALDDLEAVDREVLGPHPDLRRVFESSQVSAAEKDRILVSLLGDHVSGVVTRFLRVLNRRGRLGLISPIAREARQAWDRRHKRIPVSVSTAVPLDADQESAVREHVGRMISGTPLVQYKTDPSLIGGLLVQIGDQVFDSSIRNRLEQVRQRLIEGKTHEIQSRRDQFSYPA